MNSPITIIAIIASVTGLFGYTLKLVLPRLMNKIDESDKQIRTLTATFTETQNHKTTEMTNALKSLVASNEKYSIAVEAQTEVFKLFIEKRIKDDL